MSKKPQTYFKEIIELATKELIDMFDPKKDSSEKIVKYDWCGDLKCKFKEFNDKDHDDDDVDNLAKLVFTANNSKVGENALAFPGGEDDPRVKKVSECLDEALKKHAKKFQELQEKGYLFCYDDLSVVVTWHKGNYNKIMVCFHTY